MPGPCSRSAPQGRSRSSPLPPPGTTWSPGCPRSGDGSGHGPTPATRGCCGATPSPPSERSPWETSTPCTSSTCTERSWRGAGGYRDRLSASTVLNLHRVLVQSLGWAERFGLLGRSPARAARPPRPHRAEPRVVDPALASRILHAASGTRLELPVALALATGMRRGEILGLRWGDLSEDRSVAHVRRSLQATGAALVFEEPKTRRSRRSVALPGFLHPYLERHRTDQATRREDRGDGWIWSDLVIDSGDGSPVNPDSMSSAWRFLVIRSGLPHVRFHDLRHAHATLLLCQGVHPKVVSERLGHSTVGITLDIYSHVIPGMQAEAALAFDRLFPER